jgi:CubicO group peptidase (beta-lactamase class C family)
MEKRILFVTLALAFLLTSCTQAAESPMPDVRPTAAAMSTRPDEQALAQFEEQLEDLRQQLKIPGMSAAIVKDQELVWSRGFGYADLEGKVEATADTPYHLASVTKPFAAIIIMQLVEEGILDLEEPVAQYGIDLESPGVIRVKHLLSMTSEGNPGEQYNYDGGRYALLSRVIEAASGKSFQELLFERIIEPLDMTNTAPNPAGCIRLESSTACDRVYDKIAKPYQLDPRYGVAEAYYWNQWLEAAAGLISTVEDLARFDIALDQNILVSQGTKEQMFAPTISTSGDELPYGFGWFTQNYGGTRLIWAYGYWSPSASSLILKAPDENITFVILANTDNLSRPYRLGDGDVLRSPMALAFYKRFVFELRTGQAVPDVDWATVADPGNEIRQYDDEDLRNLLEKELESYQMLSESMRGVEQLGQRITARLAADVDPKVYDAYVGQCQAPAEWGAKTFTVMREDDALYMENSEGARFELFPQSETGFFHLSLNGTDDFEVSFIQDEAGRVTEALVEVGGREFTCKMRGTIHSSRSGTGLRRRPWRRCPGRWRRRN